MTDLSRLKVSLTKHNAHKVAQLLKTFHADDVLLNLDEIRADPAQARKNLSAGQGNQLPPVWQKAQQLGAQAIDALVLLAIVFSHHQLIRAMANAHERNSLSATLRRDHDLGEKEYTNFARILDQLGVVTRQAHEGVTFDLAGIMQMPGIGPLFGELLAIKLEMAGWKRANTLSTEAAALGLHLALGLTAGELAAWMEIGAPPSAAETGFSAKDRDFFQQQSEGPQPDAFTFRSGHTFKDIDPVEKNGSPKLLASQLHNELQNQLYDWLVERYGVKNVGTELDTGCGTSIDLAIKDGDRLIFFEIKTSASVRANIRQALPQLLEYAHWIEDSRADEFIVVSHLPITDPSARYLRHLRVTYGIPITYRQFDLKQKVLV